MLRLSLPEGKTLWALAQPFSNAYIHEQGGIGFQKDSLIITQENTIDNPRVVDLDKLPEWAKSMIHSSVLNGDLINTGDSIKPMKVVKEELVVTEEVKAEEVTIQKPQANKKVAKRKTKRL